MRMMRYMTCVAMAALVAGSAVAQTAPQSQPQTAPQGAAAGVLNPAAEQAPAQAAAPAPQFQLADGVLATVNDSIITGFDLRQRVLMLIAMTQVQPTQENLPAISRQAPNNLVDERLQAQEVAKYATGPDGLKVTDAEVDEELAGRAQEAGTTAENYLGYLQQIGIQPQTIREEVRNQIGWQRLVGGRFQGRARPSQGAIDAALRQVNEAATKKQYLIGEVYIEAARVGGQQAALNGANQLVAQMVQGAPFQQVAQQFSSAPSAVRGGDAGWVVEGTVQPALQAALDQLEVGQLSRPIPVDGGVYILYMRDKRDGSATNLVQLKQVMVELPETATDAQLAAASQRLETLRPQLTCDNMLDRARSEQGLLGTDLGESDVANLAPQFQQVARSAAVGSISTPVRTPLGLHLLAVCGRRAGAAQAPSRDQVQGQLFRQNLSTLERRYMRDLRADALIEYKE